MGENETVAPLCRHALSYSPTELSPVRELGLTAREAAVPSALRVLVVLAPGTGGHVLLPVLECTGQLPAQSRDVAPSVSRARWTALVPAEKSFSWAPTLRSLTCHKYVCMA